MRLETVSETFIGEKRVYPVPHIRVCPVTANNLDITVQEYGSKLSQFTEPGSTCRLLSPNIPEIDHSKKMISISVEGPGVVNISLSISLPVHRLLFDISSVDKQARKYVAEYTKQELLPAPYWTTLAIRKN